MRLSPGRGSKHAEVVADEESTRVGFSLITAKDESQLIGAAYGRPWPQEVVVVIKLPEVKYREASRSIAR
jgi:hypothetical protein